MCAREEGPSPSLGPPPEFRPRLSLHRLVLMSTGNLAKGRDLVECKVFGD